MRPSAGAFAALLAVASGGLTMSDTAVGFQPFSATVAADPVAAAGSYEAATEAAVGEPPTVDPAESSAAATSAALRIRPPAPFFPLNPSPRCDILDNFGDPRSSGRRHEGVDILATLGQEVLAITDGVLSAQVVVGVSGNATLSGNAWTLVGGDRTTYFYAHLSGFAPGLGVGSHVAAGDVIGYVGDTGNPGPGNYHLHFEMHPNGGAAINSLPLLDVPRSCRIT